MCLPAYTHAITSLTDVFHLNLSHRVGYALSSLFIISYSLMIDQYLHQRCMHNTLPFPSEGNSNTSMSRIELQYYSRFVEEIRVSNDIETSSTSLTHHFGPLVGFHISPLPGYGRRHFDRPRVMLVPEQKPNRFRKVSRCLYMHHRVHSIPDLMFFFFLNM